MIRYLNCFMPLYHFN